MVSLYLLSVWMIGFCRSAICESLGHGNVESAMTGYALIGKQPIEIGRMRKPASRKDSCAREDTGRPLSERARANRETADRPGKQHQAESMTAWPQKRMSLGPLEHLRQCCQANNSKPCESESSMRLCTKEWGRCGR